MSYIRIKKIQQHEYAYFVESISTEKGPRQKVKQYLGKVEHHQLPEYSPKDTNHNGKKDFLISLVKNHLTALNFIEKENKLIKENIVFKLDKCLILNTKSEKEVVLALHPGFLCNFTLRRILDFKKTEDLRKDGNTLANFFQEAGLQITEKEFVQFYKLL